MKKVILLLLSACSIFACTHTPKWELVWEDNFDGAEPDTSVWSRIPRGKPDWQNTQSFDDRCYEMRNGLLILKGIVNDNTEADAAQYLTGGLWTKDKRAFHGGRIEVRARIHPADGAFPAVWTCGYNKNWPSNGEIDMMEYYLADLGIGKEPVLTTNFCVSSDNPHDAWAQNWKSVFTPVTYYQKKDKDWMNKYHVYRMDWDEESIALYVDDELRNWINIDEFRNGDGAIAFHNPQFMMLNLAIKNHGAGLVDDYAFEVDYFRVYQKKPDLVKPSMVEGLKVLKQTATTCTLQWQPSTDNQGIYRYDIYKEGGRFVGSTTDCEFSGNCFL